MLVYIHDVSGLVWGDPNPKKKTEYPRKYWENFRSIAMHILEQQDAEGFLFGIIKRILHLQAPKLGPKAYVHKNTHMYVSIEKTRMLTNLWLEHEENMWSDERRGQLRSGRIYDGIQMPKAFKKVMDTVQGQRGVLLLSGCTARWSCKSWDACLPPKWNLPVHTMLMRSGGGCEGVRGGGFGASKKMLQALSQNTGGLYFEEPNVDVLGKELPGPNMRLLAS